VATERRGASALSAPRSNALSLTDSAFQVLLDAVLSRGASLRFRAAGPSMYPFVRDGDIITIARLGGRALGSGEIVAFRHPSSGRLTVHRVVERRLGGITAQGDNCPSPDGFFDARAVVGRVVRVERHGRRIASGFGPERVLIAWLSRRGALIPLVTLARRVGNAMAHHLGRRREGRCE
jgi:hypothetical protein